jgi:hypothetical protein
MPPLDDIHLLALPLDSRARTGEASFLNHVVTSPGKMK